MFTKSCKPQFWFPEIYKYKRKKGLSLSEIFFIQPKKKRKKQHSTKKTWRALVNSAFWLPVKVGVKKTTGVHGCFAVSESKNPQEWHKNPFALQDLFP